MNLITSPWIPVKTQSGQHKTIRPSDITLDFVDDPIVAFDLPRPDFNGAMAQFMIGLLQTCCPPSSNDDWKKWMRVSEVPSPEVLQQKFEKVTFAFELLGDGPRFMQDLNLDTKKLDLKSVGSLLIDEPGEKTLKDNKDHFVKRDRFESLSLTMAALALFSLQLNAPSGGAGHRTGLRGGGPLTTLIVPKAQMNRPQTLWELLWANVLPKGQIEEDAPNWESKPETIFPWLAPTITSESEKTITPMNNHPLLMFWATPRRIRFDSSLIKNWSCGISGAQNIDCIQSYYTQNYGANYLAWQHVLSPYYKKGTDTLPLHPNAGGMTYKHWLGWTFGDSSEKSAILVSKNISVARERRIEAGACIWAFGYDMDNMKARGWQESKIPLILFEHTTFQKENLDNFFEVIKSGLNAAEESLFTLRKQIRSARKSEGTPEGIDREFWSSTESYFRKFLDDVQFVLDQSYAVQNEERSLKLEPAQEQWNRVLLRSILAIYDKWTSAGQTEFESMESFIKARRILHSKKFKNQIRKTIGLKEEAHE